jgi:superfamily I DNA/RNA helicase
LTAHCWCWRGRFWQNPRHYLQDHPPDPPRQYPRPPYRRHHLYQQGGTRNAGTGGQAAHRPGNPWHYRIHLPLAGHADPAAEATHLGYKPQFSILDAFDAGKIIADILKSTHKDEVRKVQSQISLWKNDLKSPDQMLVEAQGEWESICARTYLAYQDTLTAYQAVDFDDLIRLPVQLFKTHPEICSNGRASCITC